MCKVEAVRWVLLTEKDNNDRSGLYGYTQRTLAYNSNRIEGSTLTEDQTASLFEEGFLPPTDSVYMSKDIEEMNGHFLMFNKMLSTLDDELSEDLIKKFHFELKAGVFEDRANGYAIGEYKTRPNTVGGMAVTAPDAVQEEMKKMIDWYNSCSCVNLEVLAELHTRFESIHPFQDGNGRTGRMILFRECLRNDIVPFIIKNENRAEYIVTLHDAQIKHDYSALSKYFEKEPIEYKSKCRYFDVDNRYIAALKFKNVSKIKR